MCRTNSIYTIHILVIILAIICAVDSKWSDVLWQQHPYIVSIRNRDIECSGTILNQSNIAGKGVILTSAQCIDKIDLHNTQIGVGCTTSKCHSKDALFYDVDSYHIHDGYDGLNHNIGLIILKENITHHSAQTIEIETAINPKDNDAISVIAYTNNTLKQSINVMVVAGCNHTSFINEMCIKVNAVYVSTNDCAADSGTPIIRHSNGKQIGLITSLETYCNQPHPYSVALYLPFYYDWIASKFSPKRRLQCDPLLDADFDGFDECIDCDDSNPFVNPLAPEVCDGLDNDCDGFIDNDVDADLDGWFACIDCDDANPSVYPGAPELCDGLDNDCDGFIDNDMDADADGWFACDECDDLDNTVNPGATEICDGKDNNCDGVVDEGCPPPTTATPTTSTPTTATPTTSTPTTATPTTSKPITSTAAATDATTASTGTDDDSSDDDDNVSDSDDSSDDDSTDSVAFIVYKKLNGYYGTEHNTEHELSIDLNPTILSIIIGFCGLNVLLLWIYKCCSDQPEAFTDEADELNEPKGE